MVADLAGGLQMQRLQAAFGAAGAVELFVCLIDAGRWILRCIVQCAGTSFMFT